MVFHQKKNDFSSITRKIVELVDVLVRTDDDLGKLSESDLDKFEVLFRYRFEVFQEISKLLMKIVNDGTLYIYSKNENKERSNQIFMHSRMINSSLKNVVDEISSGNLERSVLKYREFLKVDSRFNSLSDALKHLLKLVVDLEDVCHTNISLYLATINDIINDVNQDLNLLSNGNINLAVVNKIRESLEIERRQIIGMFSDGVLAVNDITRGISLEFDGILNVLSISKDFNEESWKSKEEDIDIIKKHLHLLGELLNAEAKELVTEDNVIEDGVQVLKKE